MSQTRSKLETEYSRQLRDLHMKKEKLFHMGDMNKWEMDLFKARGIPREELLSKKDLAFGVMLPKVSILV